MSKAVSVHPECGPGWQKLYQPLIDLCDKDGITILQIKEKFGGLRFYVAGVPVPEDGSKHPIWEAIDKAERESFSTCEDCGDPTARRRDDRYWIRTLSDRYWIRTLYDRYWIRTLCDSCEIQDVK